jgi:hypothetical protein
VQLSSGNQPLVVTKTALEDERSTSLLNAQFPTKPHLFPLRCTIDKKKEQCKPFFTIFSLFLNDLAHFHAKNNIVIN